MRKLRNAVCLLIILLTVLELSAAQSDCRKPNIKPNVSSNPNVSRRRIFTEYTKVKLFCKTGFNPAAGHDSIICVKGKWKVLEKPIQREALPFRCEEKPCPRPDIPNGRTEVDENRLVTYSCEPGYGLVGFQQSECVLNDVGEYILTSPVPSCKILPECEQPTGPYLQINGSCCTAGDVALFSCEDGYEILGASTATCLMSGNWSEPAPYCSKVDQCPDPGTICHGVRTGDCCKVGSKLHYECLDGYEFAHEEDGKSITCQTNEEWSGAPPQCKPIGELVCPKIPFEENNLMPMSDLPPGRDVFLVYDEVDLGCKPGYDTEDNEMYLVCDADGTWDSPIPVCKEKGPCSRPAAPSNGYINKLIVNPKQEQFPILYEMVMECDEGYTSANGYFGTQCLGNDVWSNYPLNCTRITCSDPGFPNNGYRIGDDFSYTSNVTFGCIGSFQLYGPSVRTCEENGRWSDFTTVCDAGDTDCLDPGVPVNSYRKGNDFNIGDVVMYSCAKGTTLLGNGTRECLNGDEGAYWSGSEIECRAQHEFTGKEEATDAFAGTMTVVARSSIQSSSKDYFARSAMSSDKASISGTDVFFAFDGSGSITDEEFKQAKDFSETLIRQIGISHGHGGTRVAMAVFSKKAVEHVQLTDKSVEEVIKSIRKMQRKKEGTDITKGLEKVMEFAQRSKDHNPNRKKIAFIVTDGIWNQGGDPTKVANKLRHIYKVEIFALAIGTKRNDEALLKIAGDEKHVLSFKSHKDLVNIVAKAISRDVDYSACGLERPVLNDTSTSGNRKKGGAVARIVGGQYVKKPWPWMAALRLKEGSGYETKCGGSIIHKQWILTAAHCFKNKEVEKLNPTDWQVTVGATDLNSESGWDLYISAITLHNQYNMENLDYDMALAKLKHPVAYDLYIRPICLPPMFDDMPKNVALYNKDSMATVIGYGHTKVKHPGLQRGKDKVETRLKELDIKLQSEDNCKKPVDGGNEIRQPTDRMMCAGHGLGGEDACQGDSGGPLMQLTNSNSANNTQDRWYIVGINSWGIGCGLKDHYGYYSHVAKLRQWINNVTKVEYENAIPQAKKQIIG